MKNSAKVTLTIYLIFISSALIPACGRQVENTAEQANMSSAVSSNTNQQIPAAAYRRDQNESSSLPKIPNLQAQLLDDRNKNSDSPLAKFDFENYTYSLPRGWENPDGSDVTLVNGRLPTVGVDAKGEMTDEEKSEAKANRRIGMSYITTKYLDVTGDGQDEALVILKIETGGSAIPQIVYVYTWKDGEPELIWPFRTGDRSDGGLKNLRAENGELVVELYGEDRFLLGQTETGKITNDYEQLCCPSFFTRSFYKWNGKNFLMQRKRLTFSIADPTSPPVENMGEIVNKPQKNFKSR